MPERESDMGASGAHPPALLCLSGEESDEAVGGEGGGGSGAPAGWAGGCGANQRVRGAGVTGPGAGDPGG